MKTYFVGGSQNERGTLPNMKLTMGQHSVKTKVLDCFNHVEHMFDTVCDGMLTLLAMQCLGIPTLDVAKPESEASLDALTEVSIVPATCIPI